MSLGDVLFIIALAIIFTLIMMLAQKSLQGKRFTIVRFCKSVIIFMTVWFVLDVLDKFNWPKWIMYTISIVTLLAVAAILDIVWKGKDNDESD